MNQEEQPKLDPETICRSCGRCCVRKEFVKGKTVFTKDFCPNLERDERGKCSCKIYDRRLKTVVTISGKDVRCVSAEEAYKQGLLPADCPYVYYYQHRDGDGIHMKKLESFLMFQGICEIQNWDGVFPKPKKNCNHCYGRGYVGKNINTQTYAKCGCMW